jgi:putative ABC transport system substrate-binding protein
VTTRSFVCAALIAACSCGMTPSLGQGLSKGSATHRIGFLSAADHAALRPVLEAFEQQLASLSNAQGAKVAIEYRFAEGHFDRLPALVQELLKSGAELIVTQSTPSALAAKRATASVPIVIVGVADPVGVGLVKSLARPGGNITGVSNMTAELAGKRLELLKQAVPAASRIAVFINPDDPNAALQMRYATQAARALNLQLRPLVHIRAPADLENAFRTASADGAAAGIRMVDPLVSPLRNATTELAARYRLPIVYPFREDAEAGGLIAYGSDQADQYRRAAMLVDKILNGARTGDLSVEQPSKFELVINAKAAKAIGVVIPQSLLLRADRVIE